MFMFFLLIFVAFSIILLGLCTAFYMLNDDLMEDNHKILNFNKKYLEDIAVLSNRLVKLGNKNSTLEQYIKKYEKPIKTSTARKKSK